MFPEDRYSYILLEVTYGAKSMYEEAIKTFEKSKDLAAFGDPLVGAWAEANQGIIAAKREQKAEAQETLSKLENQNHEQKRTALLATLAFAIDDYDKGFSWLENAWKFKDPWLCHLKIWDDPDGVRADPRYSRLLEKLGFSREPPFKLDSKTGCVARIRCTR